MNVFGPVISLRSKIVFLSVVFAFMSICAAFPGSLPHPVFAFSAPPILQQTATAFSPASPVAKLTLTGTVTSYAGGLTDTGTVTMTAEADGSGTLALAMSTAGAHSENFDPVVVSRTCQWVDNSGTAHNMESGSCAVPLVWFMPSLALQPSITYAAVLDQGIGILGASQLRLLAVTNSTAAPPSSGSTGIGSVQLGLDPTTLLPSLVEYVIHPDVNPMSTVTIDVSFANYVLQNGIEIPQSIQRRINGALDLDMVIQSSSTN